MSIYTLILLTGALGGNGETLDIDRQPTSERFAHVRECHRRGADLTARQAERGLQDSRSDLRDARRDGANGRFVGYQCVEIGGAGAGGATPGVTLYELSGLRGENETFYADDPDLGDNRLGRNRASSVRVPDGCTVTLYDRVGYGGSFVTLSRDVLNLTGTKVGSNDVSSLKGDCQRGGGRPPHGGHPGPDRDPANGAVTLYAGENYSGDYEVLYDDDRDLGDNRIGRNRVSSVAMAPGCAARLFGRADFGGVDLVLRDSARSLRGTALGNNNTSSIRVSCRR